MEVWSGGWGTVKGGKQMLRAHQSYLVSASLTEPDVG